MNRLIKQDYAEQHNVYQHILHFFRISITDPFKSLCLSRETISCATSLGSRRVSGFSRAKFLRRKGVCVRWGTMALMRRSGLSSARPCVKLTTAAFALEYTVKSFLPRA